MLSSCGRPENLCPPVLSLSQYLIAERMRDALPSIYFSSVRIGQVGSIMLSLPCFRVYAFDQYLIGWTRAIPLSNFEVSALHRCAGGSIVAQAGRELSPCFASECFCFTSPVGRASHRPPCSAFRLTSRGGRDAFSS